MQCFFVVKHLKYPKMPQLKTIWIELKSKVPRSDGTCTVATVWLYWYLGWWEFGMFISQGAMQSSYALRAVYNDFLSYHCFQLILLQAVIWGPLHRGNLWINTFRFVYDDLAFFATVPLRCDYYGYKRRKPILYWSRYFLHRLSNCKICSIICNQLTS